MSREIKFRAWDAKKMKIRAGCNGFHKQNGYVLAKAPYHPYANKRGYVPLHRLVMENHLGRYLTPRKELVHHIDGNRSNNNIQNLKLTTPSEHYFEEHFKARNPNGQFVAEEEVFGEMKYRLYDRDKNIVQIYTLKELISKTYRRAKFEFRGRWTGEKDKCGREVYEGDIWFVDGLPLVVEMIDGCWQSVGRLPEGDIYDKVTFDLIDFKYVEIAGNIHEHSHLLEETA